MNFIQRAAMSFCTEDIPFWYSSTIGDIYYDICDYRASSLAWPFILYIQDF